MTNIIETGKTIVTKTTSSPAGKVAVALLIGAAILAAIAVFKNN